MAPNAEEELLVVKPWGPQPEKERLRPPTYNAEDYAIALRRWGRRPLGTVQDSQGTLPSTTSSSSGYASGSGEMTLRQFTSVSELLNKLRADLRLAFPRFKLRPAQFRSEFDLQRTEKGYYVEVMCRILRPDDPTRSTTIARFVAVLKLKPRDVSCRSPETNDLHGENDLPYASL